MEQQILDLDSSEMSVHNPIWILRFQRCLQTTHIPRFGLKYLDSFLWIDPKFKKAPAPALTDWQAIYVSLAHSSLIGNSWAAGCEQSQLAQEIPFLRQTILLFVDCLQVPEITSWMLVGNVPPLPFEPFDVRFLWESVSRISSHCQERVGTWQICGVRLGTDFQALMFWELLYSNAAP